MSCFARLPVPVRRKTGGCCQVGDFGRERERDQQTTVFSVCEGFTVWGRGGGIIGSFVQTGRALRYLYCDIGFVMLLMIW